MQSQYRTQTRQKSHEASQALPPAIEKALEMWALRMDAQGFPPRLDILKEGSVV